MPEASAVATAIPSLWSAINSWFTPAVLFLLLNLMIATIALTSSLTPSTPTPSHDIPPYPHELQPQHDDGENPPKRSPSVSILDRVKSLGLFSSPDKKTSEQQRQQIPLIPPEELYTETHYSLNDPYEKQGPGHPGSPSPVGKFEAFDLYGYLPGEPTSEIPRESNPAHYIFEPTHPQEVLLPGELNEKVDEEVGEEEGVEAEENMAEEEEEEVVAVEETGVEDGSEEERETETEIPGLLHLRPRGIQRSESLNVKLSSSEEGRGGGQVDEGDVGEESVEKRRLATVREGKVKWGGDEEVDARADDFINRFKQQLKLQRMDSMARQKDISKARSF